MTAGTEPAGAVILDNLRRRLAASGTTLFVLDLSATGGSPLAGLAATTGGAVYRSTRPDGCPRSRPCSPTSTTSGSGTAPPCHTRSS